MSVAPTALAENAGLACRGEAPWPPAGLTATEAKRLLAASNACGRPNADVLRRRLAVAGGEPAASWQIDFPVHFTAQEAALYERPFAHLRERAGEWRNPHAIPALRRALARVSRWLAMPADAEAPDWRWIEEDFLPDASLVVVARDDDFTQGVLASPLFAAWWTRHRAEPVLAIESFPFPWPPGTALSSLSRAQEDQRHAIARASRGGDAAGLAAAVSAAYGWEADLEQTQWSALLDALHRERAGTAASRPPTV